MINTIIAAPHLSASTKGASLGWLSPLSVDGLRIEGKQHRFRVDVESVTADRSWPRLLATSPDLGKISVAKPRVWLKFPIGEKGTVSPILSPTFTAAIKDAALSVQHDQTDDSVIDIEGVDLTVHLRDSDHGMLLSVDSLDVYKQERLSPEHCDQLLRLINPSLEDAAEMEGEFSLSLTNLNVPIGVSEEQMLQRFEVQGELALHQVAIETDNEFLQTLAKLVADAHEKRVPPQTRVVKNALVQLQMRGGRLYHEGLRFGFPDIDPRLEVHSRGSIRLDETLDLFLEVPRLDADKQKERGPVLCHLTGTVGNPQLSAKDASLVVLLPDRCEPLIDVDGVDLTVRVDEWQGRRVISVDPAELLRRRKISRQLAAGLFAEMSKRPLAKQLVQRYLESTLPELAALAEERSVDAIDSWVVIRIGAPITN